MREPWPVLTVLLVGRLMLIPAGLACLALGLFGTGGLFKGADLAWVAAWSSAAAAIGGLLCILSLVARLADR